MDNQPRPRKACCPYQEALGRETGEARKDKCQNDFPPVRTFYNELTGENARFALAEQSLTEDTERPPDWSPQIAPNEFWDCVMGVADRAVWYIKPPENFGPVNTNQFKLFKAVPEE